MAIERGLYNMPEGEGTLGNLGEVGIDDEKAIRAPVIDVGPLTKGTRWQNGIVCWN